MVTKLNLSAGTSFGLLTEKYLPKKYEMGKEFVSGRKVHISDLEKAEDMMKRFIIINVPENYLDVRRREAPQENKQYSLFED